MFGEKQISLIFGNIADIYKMSNTFLSQLELSVSDSEAPQHALIGQCFLTHVSLTALFFSLWDNHLLAPAVHTPKMPQPAWSVAAVSGKLL